MPVWLVRATWTEDEAEANEQWEVNADTAHDAVKAVVKHIRFQPHHVEARQCKPESADEALVMDLPPGKARRISQ